MKLPSNTRRICEEASKNSDTCFLQFSTGKDSVACLLILREFFKNVIPYHKVNIPTIPIMGILQEYLDYIKYVFDTEVILIINYETAGFINELLYQPFKDVEECYDLEVPEFDHFAPARALAKERKITNYWCSAGTKASDTSLMKQMIGRNKGLRTRDRSVYPVGDWSNEQVCLFLKEHGILLPREYAGFKKSMMGIPNVSELEWLEDNHPEDLAKVELVYPMIRASLAKNKFRKMHLTKN